jgi:sulfhydrogenase subunit beta (sulfur reductase)
MATRAQTPRAPRKKAAPTRNSARAAVDLTSKTDGSKLKPKNGKPSAVRSKVPAESQEGDLASRQPRVIAAEQLESLIAALVADGFEVIGPTARDGAVVYEPVKSASDLPVGWTDEQEPGRYRLKKTDNPTFFGYSLGAQSWKQYLHPPEVLLFAAEKQDGAFRILNNDTTPPEQRAFLGVRACELAAIKAQDRVLLGDKYRDPIYAGRRENAFIVAVQCSKAAATCFCASVGSGPRVGEGFDLLLTELADQNGHRFVVQARTQLGAKLIAQIETTPASTADLEAAEAAVAAASQQQRKLDTAGLKEFLYENFENPHWDKVSARCLSCANCTMSCPTCFCTTVDDATDVTGTRAERWRRWDSCFTQSFSYIHGGSVRTSSKARYRQWMTHKLAAWTDQFGSSGCVGCGRCITWCPAAIDITEEVRAMREGGLRADA